ncbi:hypothetical protein FRUB_00489 [Fimbriiglobus ruber]|uniref:Uncharacterized protein n=1 Tax=Fimbriiglobus ruber TaxID=1908690 RepID=A0A225DZ43_9BACT|nr:hypothetical protein FRUB_00489 [Fimbriiglobus ruber]
MNGIVFVFTHERVECDLSFLRATQPVGKSFQGFHSTTGTIIGHPLPDASAASGSK